MKRIIFIVVLILGTQNVFAQGVKVGFIYSDSVLTAMPEYEAAKNKIETYSKQLSAQLQSKGQEFEEKAQDFENNSSTWTELVVTDKRDELVRLETNIREFQQQAESKLRSKENEVLNPLYQKIEAAIKEVAAAENYDYVTPSQVFLYANEKHNLTSKIISKLGGTRPGGN